MEGRIKELVIHELLNLDFDAINLVTAEFSTAYELSKKEVLDKYLLEIMLNIIKIQNDVINHYAKEYSFYLEKYQELSSIILR